MNWEAGSRIFQELSQGNDVRIIYVRELTSKRPMLLGGSQIENTLGAEALSPMLHGLWIHKAFESHPKINLVV